ncbi:hypothetical protein CPB83DRAFT_904069 [Crepidotus variabilis]|uniref:Uncharacterized protein n=1 Tax=Crepidotus variabilis TaxID=179855 RepID=A0A9P6ELG3_9AGAR|nr:hypothetical protein CPB83DRAFT_904069 [Crepidotus variabilis]
MVSLTEVHSSNARILASLPARLVAVFVGATSGIGEMTLKQFAKHVRQPRIYFSGRSQEAGDRITAECRIINPEGTYIFIRADLSLIRTVDDVCGEIRSKEKAVNLLFISTRSLLMHTETSEGLHFFTALAYYSRLRFIENLLPLLQKATDLRRVINVSGGPHAGQIHINDFQARNLPLRALRGHLTSMSILALETLAKSAPDVSFIEQSPGIVTTNLGKDATGLLFTIVQIVLIILGPLISISEEESGARHLFIATSARYSPAAGEDANSGVPLTDGAAIARGTTGVSGSGVYAIDWDGESASAKAEAILANFRQQGIAKVVWDHTEGEFKRITDI